MDRFYDPFDRLGFRVRLECCWGRCGLKSRLGQEHALEA